MATVVANDVADITDVVRNKLAWQEALDHSKEATTEPLEDDSY